MDKKMNKNTVIDSNEFLNAPSPLNDRDTRREAIKDYTNNIIDECESLMVAVSQNDVFSARKRFEEIKEWFDALDDNLCDRDVYGRRID